MTDLLEGRDTDDQVPAEPRGFPLWPIGGVLVALALGWLYYLVVYPLRSAWAGHSVEVARPWDFAGAFMLLGYGLVSCTGPWYFRWRLRTPQCGRARLLDLLTMLGGLLLAFTLHDYVQREPDQRAAFKQFLQTRIVDKPGVHVPKLTADESKSFGEYVTHYAVITDFNSDMDASVKPLGTLVQKSAVRSLGDVVSRRDDLKAVQSVPQINSTLDSSLKVADYVDALKAQIEINGAVVKVQDAKVQAELNALLQDLNAQAQSVQKAQARM
nr:hypothetical protein [Tanacetum cinerariifolium]